MSMLHVHLLFTHGPLFGVVFGAFALGYGLFRKQSAACDVAYAIFVVSGILAGFTYLTGSLSEDAAERLSGVTETLVSIHQEAALLALVVTVLLGFAGAALLMFRRFGTMLWSRSIVGTLIVAAFVSMGYTANLGGQIRRPEIRTGAASPPAGDGIEREHGSDGR